MCALISNALRELQEPVRSSDGPGLSAGLLLMMPPKGISFSMRSDEPRRLVLRNWQALTLLHQPPPCVLMYITKSAQSGIYSIRPTLRNFILNYAFSNLTVNGKKIIRIENI
jgi:hypothetical protein